MINRLQGSGFLNNNIPIWLGRGPAQRTHPAPGASAGRLRNRAVRLDNDDDNDNALNIFQPSYLSRYDPPRCYVLEVRGRCHGEEELDRHDQVRQKGSLCQTSAKTNHGYFCSRPIYRLGLRETPSAHRKGRRVLDRAPDLICTSQQNILAPQRNRASPPLIPPSASNAVA